MLVLDHVILAVADLDTAANRLWDDHGLATVAGGRHPGHGTGNRIVPLGLDYLELMAVVDAGEAATSVLGRFLSDFVAEGGGLMAVCLRTDAMDNVVARLGIDAIDMSRTRPDGVELSWRLAGLEGALGPKRLPFFIEWHNDASDHPGRAVVDHAVGVEGLAWVELGGGREELTHRLGTDHPDVRCVGGAAGVHAAAIRTTAGKIVL